VVTIPAHVRTDKPLPFLLAYTEWKTGLHPGSSCRARASLLASARASGVDLENAKAGTCFYEFYAPPQYKLPLKKYWILPEVSVLSLSLLSLKPEQKDLGNP